MFFLLLLQAKISLSFVLPAGANVHHEEQSTTTGVVCTEDIIGNQECWTFDILPRLLRVLDLQCQCCGHRYPTSTSMRALTLLSKPFSELFDLKELFYTLKKK